MSDIKIRNLMGKHAQCDRRSCVVHTTRVIEVSRGDERKLYHLCWFCSQGYELRVDDALGLLFTPRHSAAHARMGETPTRVSFTRDNKD